MATAKEQLIARATELGIPVKNEDGSSLSVKQLRELIAAHDAAHGNDRAESPIESPDVKPDVDNTPDDAESIIESIMPSDAKPDVKPDEPSASSDADDKPATIGYKFEMTDSTVTGESIGIVIANILNTPLNRPKTVQDEGGLREAMIATLRAQNMPQVLIDQMVQAAMGAAANVNAPDRALAMDDILWGIYTYALRLRDELNRAQEWLDSAISVYNAGLHDRKSHAIARNGMNIIPMRGAGASTGKVNNTPDSGQRRERVTRSDRASMREYHAYASKNGYTPQIKMDDRVFTVQENAQGAIVVKAADGEIFASPNAAQDSYLNSPRNVHQAMQLWNGAEWVKPETIGAFYAEIIASVRG